MKRAVALQYEAATPTSHGMAPGEGEDAPVVVCAGEGDLAARMEREARDHGVPVVRDVPLCEALAELRVGEPIPEALYEAVAVILRELSP